MSWVVQAGGLVALAWSSAVMGGVILATTYLVVRRDAPVLIASLVSVPALIATTVSLTTRPQALSFPLTVVAAAAWWRSSRDGGARWWLVPLTFGWACIHGFWLVVPVMGALVALGLALERRPRREVLKQLTVTGACVAAAAITPVGPRLLLSGYDVSAITGFIEEWQPAERGMPAFLFVAGMLLAAAALWMRGAEPTWSEILLLGLAAYLSVSHGRTIALAAMIAAPLLAAALTARLKRGPEPLRAREVVAVLAALVIGAGVAAAAAPGRAAEPSGFPTALSPRLDALAPGTVVCNDYWVGGWLLWAHPDLVPIIDGRTELYTVNDLEDYVTLSRGAPGWDEVVAGRGCTAALVEASGPLAERLADSGWMATGQDGRWSLFTAP